MDELGEVGWRAQAARERHALGQRLLDLLRHREEHRRAEDAGRDRHVADADLGEVARDRQRHADDAALRRRVGGLADLAVVGGDARRRDQDAALAGRLGVVLAHRFGGEPDHVEAADEVDGDDLGEQGERVRPLLADGSRRRADAGAVDEADELAGRRRRGDDSLRVGFLADVAANEATADLRRDRGPALFLQVGDDDGRAARRRASAPCLRRAPTRRR